MSRLKDDERRALAAVSAGDSVHRRFARKLSAHGLVKDGAVTEKGRKLIVSDVPPVAPSPEPEIDLPQWKPVTRGERKRKRLEETETQSTKETETETDANIPRLDEGTLDN
jgi:hypothetical protein